VADVNATNLKQYGLDKPIVITVLMDNGSKNVIEVGNIIPSRNGYYLKKKESNEVFVVSLDSGDILAADERSFWNNYIYAAKRADLTGYSISNKGETAFSVHKDKKGVWKMTSPIKAGVNTQKLNEILDSIIILNAYDLVDKNPVNLDKYGLKNPIYSMGVETAKGKIKVLFGDEKVQNSLIYAKLENRKDVFTIQEKYISLIDTPIEDVINPFIYFAGISDIAKIVVKINGETITSEIATDSSGNSDNDIYKVNGRNANVVDSGERSLFRDYFSILIGITLDKVDATEKPKYKPEISITYFTKKDGKSTNVDYVSKNADYYYAFVNGKYIGLLVGKDKLNNIQTTYAKLISAMG